MDATVKQMLEGFGYGISNYTSSLGPDNAKIREAKRIYDDLVKKAEAGADVRAISMDSGFMRLGQLVGELASETPLSPGELAAYGDGIRADEIPPASVPAAGYRMAWDQLDAATKQKMKNYYDRIFAIEAKAENAVFFNTMLREDGVLLDMSREPLIEEAKKALAAAREAYSPTVNYQQGLAVKTYGAVGTVQELEFEGAKMAEMSNVEHEWDAQYLEVIGLLPACAQAIESFGPTDENVGKLRNSHVFMAEFMGLAWDDVFENERYLYFWENVAWDRLPAAKKARYAVTTPRAYADVLKNQFYEPFVKDLPAPVKSSERRVRFWGREYDAQEGMRLLGNPPRPEVTP